MTRESSSFVEIEGYLIQESKDEYVIDFYSPLSAEVHLAHLPKNSVQLEDSYYVGRVKLCTFTLPEWLAIDMEISQFCQERGKQ